MLKQHRIVQLLEINLPLINCYIYIFISFVLYIAINGITCLLCAEDLYKQHIKGHWQTLNHVPYQSKSIVVELNLTSSNICVPTLL